MGSSIASKVLSAIAGALTVDWVDDLLDCMGLSDDDARLVRTIIKASASAVAAIVVAAILDNILGAES